MDIGWLVASLLGVLSSYEARGEVPLSNKRDLFESERLVYVHISDWPSEWTSPDALSESKSSPGARIEIFMIDPKSATHCPKSVLKQSPVYSAKGFSLGTSGNMTKGTPKSSYKIKLPKDKKFVGMKTLNLKSMWNDVSQMREAVAWKMFAKMGVPAPKHTYARLCIGDRYYGLYSLIEQVDEEFLLDRFSNHSLGNLYKGYWADIGPATFERRKDENGDDSGRQYFKAKEFDDRTYRLSTHTSESDPKAFQTYDDLASLIRALHTEDPKTDAFAVQMSEVFDVEGFLRWAAVNLLLGAWDNYWATPANFYIYNHGASQNFMQNPQFVWIPWDYDNTFGISYFSTRWQYVDVLDWPASTRTYYEGKKTADLPLLIRILQNPGFKKIYLDQLRKTLDRTFNSAWVGAEIAHAWDKIATSVFLESDGAHGAPHTGRAFTNDQVYWNGKEGFVLQSGAQHIPGILEYVHQRSESARQQLKKLP